MADVALDLFNSNPKELYVQGLRAFVLQVYDTAVLAFSKISELLTIEHESDIHDSLGDVFLYIGKSLLEGVLKKAKEESEKEDVVEVEGGKENKEDDAKAEKVVEDKQENKEDEGDEDLTKLEIAWEVLQVAKCIFTSRGDDGKENLAETYIVLGEIAVESGNFASAVEDVLEGLKIQKTLYENDSNILAANYWLLGIAYSGNDQIDKAIENYNSGVEYLQNRLTNLKKNKERKKANAEEIADLDNMIPEAREKIAALKNIKIITEYLQSTGT